MNRPAFTRNQTHDHIKARRFSRSIGTKQTDDLATLAGRRAREDELDGLVGAWTRQHRVDEVVERCLAARVAAGPMHNSAGQNTDPHLAARGYLVPLFQPPIGNMTFEGAAFHATGMAPADIRPAPALGQHTRAVCRELGYGDDEIEAMLAAGTIETEVSVAPEA